MNPKEKYNAIIYKIDELIQKGISDKKVIENSAFKAGCASFLTDKERRSLFCFMTDLSVKQYISERQVMLTYEKMLDKSWKELDKNELYDLSGIESEKSFIQKFEKTLGMPPKEACDKNDRTMLKPPLTWDYISEEKRTIFTDFSSQEKDIDMTFGIPSYQFVKAMAAQNLQVFYGLNKNEAEFAFHLAEEKSLSYEDVFEYVYNYVWKYIDNIDEDPFDFAEVHQNIRDIRMEEELSSEAVMHLYFHNNLSFGDIRLLLENLEYDPEYLKTLSVPYCRDMIKRQKKAEMEEERYAYNAEHEDPPYFLDPDTDNYVDEYGDRYEPEDFYIGKDEYYDLNNDEDYQKLCKETLKNKGYRGNPGRRLPKKYDYLCPAAEEQERFVTFNDDIIDPFDCDSVPAVINEFIYWALCKKGFIVDDEVIM